MDKNACNATCGQHPPFSEHRYRTWLLSRRLVCTNCTTCTTGAPPVMSSGFMRTFVFGPRLTRSCGLENQRRWIGPRHGKTLTFQKATCPKPFGTKQACRARDSLMRLLQPCRARLISTCEVSSTSSSVWYASSTSSSHMSASQCLQALKSECNLSLPQADVGTIHVELFSADGILLEKVN